MAGTRRTDGEGADGPFPAESPRTTSAVTTRATAPAHTETPWTTAKGPTVTQATTQPTASSHSVATQSTARSTMRTTTAQSMPATSETSTGPPQSKHAPRVFPQRLHVWPKQCGAALRSAALDNALIGRAAAHRETSLTTLLSLHLRPQLPRAHRPRLPPAQVGQDPR